MHKYREGATGTCQLVNWPLHCSTPVKMKGATKRRKLSVHYPLDSIQAGWFAKCRVKCRRCSGLFGAAQPWHDKWHPNTSTWHSAEETLAWWTRSLLCLSSPRSGFPEIPRLQVRTCWSYPPSTGKKRLQRRWSPYWTRSCHLAYLRRGASSGGRRSQQSKWVLKGGQSCLDMRFPSFLFTCIIQIHLTLCKVSISFFAK